MTPKSFVQGGPYIIANLYRICLSEHEPWALVDAVQICGNVANAQYDFIYSNSEKDGRNNL